MKFLVGVTVACLLACVAADATAGDATDADLLVEDTSDEAPSSTAALNAADATAASDVSAAAATGASPVAGDLETRGAAFNAWLGDIGVDRGNLSVSTFPGLLPASQYRGLRTSEPLRRGQKVLGISSKHMMTKVTAYDSHIGPLLRRLKGILPDKVVLTLHLMFEDAAKGTRRRALSHHTLLATHPHAPVHYSRCVVPPALRHL